jgi:hypothetical protein
MATIWRFSSPMCVGRGCRNGCPRRPAALCPSPGAARADAGPGRPGSHKAALGERRRAGAQHGCAPQDPEGRAERLCGSVEHFCLHNPIAKGRHVLAAYHLGRTRPGPARVEQTGNSPPDMPMRELLGVGPPVRALVNGRRPRRGVTLHWSPLERPGWAWHQHAAGCRDFCDATPCSQSADVGVNGQIAPQS